MYYIERVPLADAHFVAGSIAEPTSREVEWTAKAWAVGDECIRPGLHRVFRCAVARTATDTAPPEDDRTSWAEMRATERFVPLGPMKRSDGKVVYESRALSIEEDIVYKLKLRYCNAVALFGLVGASWSVEVFANEAATEPVFVREGSVKAPAKGYWDYAYGDRKRRDRVLVTDLPIYPAAIVVIKIKAQGSDTRAVSQIEVGKLRQIANVELWGSNHSGVVGGLVRSPKAFTYSKQEADGSSTTLLYGTTYDMSGRIMLPGKSEDNALITLRALTGTAAAFTPTLVPGFEQSLLFGTLESSPTTRDSKLISYIDFQIKGLPT